MLSSVRFLSFSISTSNCLIRSISSSFFSWKWEISLDVSLILSSNFWNISSLCFKICLNFFSLLSYSLTNDMDCGLLFVRRNTLLVIAWLSQSPNEQHWSTDLTSFSVLSNFWAKHIVNFYNGWEPRVNLKIGVTVRQHQLTIVDCKPTSTNQVLFTSLSYGKINLLLMSETTTCLSPPRTTKPNIHLP